MATRTQIYLTDDQRARLADRARREGVPVSRIIREAVDVYLEEENDLDATFGTLPALGPGIPSRSEWDTRG
ncbi:MAG TPA: ribbon-helix-helix domain-containing protein [Acidimicrobiales bacterium]|nr:ribbon-helix-helix domain-containing protein [Acidimicrobiales bacterium]